MAISPRVALSLFFGVFFVSGFSGLIYESIWSHYLKLFLGHAAYAQTLVLTIFMGGMAIGSWLSGRYSARWKHLLLRYAIAEGVVGILAISFHPGFLAITDFAYSDIVPALGDPALVTTFKWTLAAALILPQSVLLGMTFPLMSAGIIRRFPGQPGYTLSMLYFTNSLGAAIGILMSGFVFIDALGLPGTILTAGLINVALALVVWVIVRAKDFIPAEAIPVQIATTATAIPLTRVGWYRFLLLTALITGLSSFIYEISWIRMLSLVLGASTHAFELMLSAFILGLALGSLWIRRRIDRIENPVRYLAIVQVCMGLFALLSLVLYGETFNAMQWLLRALSTTDNGYFLFNVSSHILTLGIMLPTTFCAGMTLPLITFLLFRNGHGEKSIGAVYATNTLGAILGVLFAVHIGMPLLGLKNLMVIGAGLDIALGAALIWSIVPQAQTTTRTAIGLSVVGVAATIAALTLIVLDPLKMSSGVYRHGKLFTERDTQIQYQKDGKTASISLTLTGNILSIHTNGKPDASLNVVDPSKPTSDESTMILAGALPLLHLPTAKTAAVVGFGSGLTSHTLLASPSLQRLDTIEIEPAMVEAARGFKELTRRVYDDPRSHIFFEDAKTFFSAHNKKYDIIVSEPSNPWVSGVAGLFSLEFYERVRHHLNDHGLFVQWLQLYEIDIKLVASVVKALNEKFSDYIMYAANGTDLLIVATPFGHIPPFDAKLLNKGALGTELRRINIAASQDLELRKIGDRKTLRHWFESEPLPANSDYYPVLDQKAAKARFLRSFASQITELTVAPLPVLEMLGVNSAPRSRTQVTNSNHLIRVEIVHNAAILRDYFTGGDLAKDFKTLPDTLRLNAEFSRSVFITGCSEITRSTVWLETFFQVFVTISPHLTPDELRSIWRSLGVSACRKSLDIRQNDWLALLEAVGERDAKGMSRLARVLLGSDKHASRELRVYLLAAGMLGDIARNQRSDARQLWSQHSVAILGERTGNALMATLNTYSHDPHE